MILSNFFRRHSRGNQKLKSMHYHRMLMAYLAIMLIPIVLIETVNYYQMRNNSLKTLESVVRFESDKHLTQFAAQMANVSKMVSECKHNKLYNGIFQTNIKSSQLDIQEDLRQKTLWLSFFSKIYYYNEQDGFATSAVGTVSNETLVTKLLQTNNPIDFGNMQHGSLNIVKSRNEFSGKSELLMIAPLEYNYSTGQNISYLIFAIEDEMLSAQFYIQELDDTCLGVLKYKDESIFVMNPEKNEMLRSGQFSPEMWNSSTPISIKHGYVTLDWYISKSIYNQALFEMTLKQAVIVFAVLTVGLWLIFASMQKNYKPLKKMYQTLSAQNARAQSNSDEKYNVIDEMQFINMVLDDLLYTKHVLEESNAELKREQLLYYIIENRVWSGTSLYRECLNFGIRTDRASFLCLYVDDIEENHQLFEFLTDTDQLEKQNTNAYSLFLTGERYLFLLCSDLLPEALEALVRTEASCGNVVVGKAVQGIEQVGISYQSIENPDESATNNSALKKQSEFPQLAIDTLRDAVAEERLDKISFSLQTIENVIGQADLPLATAVYLETLSAFNCTLPEDMRFISGMILKNESMIAAYQRSIALIYQRFKNEQAQEDSVQKSKNACVRNRPWNIGDILQHIQNHCTESNFAIKAMACEFETTPSNLSHYFKKSTGQNLSYYIDNVKIQRAVEMLSENEKINDIAIKLGYNSTSVFIQTFKRIHGCPPKTWLQRQTNN